MAQKKGYNFASILYPDAAEWKQKIQMTHVRCLVSPLHSPDPDPFTEAEKKPHHHIILMFDSQTSLQQALDTFEFIGALSNFAEILKSLPGYAAYLIHRYNPEKEQFSEESVMAFNGANYKDALNSDEQFLMYIEEMTDYVLAHPDMTFHKLAGYARYNNRDWFKVLSCKSTLYMRTLIASQLEERREQMKIENLKNG